MCCFPWEATARDTAREHQKWHARSVDERRRLGITLLHAPWTSRRGVSLRGLTGLPREKDAIDIAFAQAQKASAGVAPLDLAASLFLDVSQNCDRGRNRYDVKVPCLTQSSTVYSYAKDCLISGQSEFALMGWPSHPPPVPLERFSNSECRRLIGDSFSCVLAAVATMAVYVNPEAPWWR